MPETCLMLCRPAVNQTSAARRVLSREIVESSTLELAASRFRSRNSRSCALGRSQRPRRSPLGAAPVCLRSSRDSFQFGLLHAPGLLHCASGPRGQRRLRWCIKQIRTGSGWDPSKI